MGRIVHWFTSRFRRWRKRSGSPSPAQGAKPSRPRRLPCGEQCVIGAVGVDTERRKWVLGIHEGATENSAACKEELDRSYLEQTNKVQLQNYFLKRLRKLGLTATFLPLRIILGDKPGR
jgi:hypothetical protein